MILQFKHQGHIITLERYGKTEPLFLITVSNGWFKFYLEHEIIDALIEVKKNLSVYAEDNTTTYVG